MSGEQAPTYFDMGENWARVRSQYELSNDQVYELFLGPFLADQVAQRKPVRFAQDPLLDAGILRRQLDYLLDCGYIYESSAFTALPPREVEAGT